MSGAWYATRAPGAGGSKRAAPAARAMCEQGRWGQRGARAATPFTPARVERPHLRTLSISDRQSGLFFFWGATVDERADGEGRLARRGSGRELAGERILKVSFGVRARWLQKKDRQQTVVTAKHAALQISERLERRVCR